MQLRHFKTLQPPGDGIARVTALCWSANNRRLAAATSDRVVLLFDDSGEKKDKFSTKPADAKGPKNYLVTGMAFSPDSTKLAVAQSDNIVFIYKLGTEWGEKKSICNKFLQSNAGVTCITWPLEQPNELVFGLTDGTVKVMPPELEPLERVTQLIIASILNLINLPSLSPLFSSPLLSFVRFLSSLRQATLTHATLPSRSAFSRATRGSACTTPTAT